MYEETLQSVQAWLRKVKEMSDWFTNDRDGDKDDIYGETFIPLAKYKRLMKDAAVSIAIPNTSVVLQLDDQGNLTIIGGGRAHIEVPYAAFAAGMAQLPAPNGIPDPVSNPGVLDNPLPGSNGGQMSALPPTNAQMSMRQNELVANYLKAKRR